MAMPALAAIVASENTEGGWVFPLMQGTSATQRVASVMKFRSRLSRQFRKVNVGKQLL
jgi:hypothetical protein